MYEIIIYTYVYHAKRDLAFTHKVHTPGGASALEEWAVKTAEMFPEDIVMWIEETVMCPGPCTVTTTEPHPHRPGVRRCSNCKEWIPQ